MTAPPERGAIRILGLDPGLRRTGWGVVEAADNRLRYLASGTVTADPKRDLAERLKQLHDGIARLIELWTPDAAAIEEIFVNRNPGSTLKLGQARGAVMLAPAQAGIAVHEYAANAVKKSVVGVGHADKAQVQAMVGMLLPSAGPQSADAADALAVAICHAHHAATQASWRAREAAAP
ncbi:MAG: crossover junction endodeoxyribonuclease RuvC [Rhodospirillaceae bacterium]|nr:crossover junction endodeoxyribonuclease RuvC [Rhodospirillaceae bacterium]MXW93219.1 crossover junction endodeoxyribonuclease RuvC [Rhodospirillaceae bacterium]MYB12641.1 crossover junction endodeoxyribonuclease RuvC [Rhodospirillaceae bacterium]MYI50457.1 crossover junction endodeoxyribonuclease RuvC [Rhodospirillaceae bacterium]